MMLGNLSLEQIQIRAGVRFSKDQSEEFEETLQIAIQKGNK